MRISFDDKSYLEIKKTSGGTILVTVSANDYENPLKKITNAVEIEAVQFDSIIEEVKK